MERPNQGIRDPAEQEGTHGPSPENREPNRAPRAGALPWARADIVESLPLTREEQQVLFEEPNMRELIIAAPPPEKCTLAHAFLYVNFSLNPNHGKVCLVQLLHSNGMNDSGLQSRAQEHGWVARGPVMFDSRLVHGYWSSSSGGGFHWWVDWGPGQTDEHKIFDRLTLDEDLPFQCHVTWPIPNPSYKQSPGYEQFAVLVWSHSPGTHV